MRIAVILRSARHAGGVETYVERVLPLLRARGHDLALFTEEEGPPVRARLDTPPGTPMHVLDGPDSLTPLHDWAPNVLFVHGLQDPTLEEALLSAGPMAMFVHDYHGTCISGSKAFRWPTPRPCTRRFGPACLAWYYLRRSGGLDPRTMLARYALQRRRLEVMRRCARLLVLSEHMRNELLAHDLAAERTVVLPCLPGEPRAPGRASPASRSPDLHLCFLGRMEEWKGGTQLIAALPEVAGTLGRRVTLTMAGDGSERSRWEAQAERIVRTADVAVAFVGWRTQDEVSSLLRDSDLLVLPSVWPEPYGLVGVEALQHGVPVAAYRVGGVGEWLIDGVNGALAPADPPTPGGLARAIVACVRTPEVLSSLRAGALRAAAGLDPARHVDALERALAACAT